MRCLVYSSKSYDETFLRAANGENLHDLSFSESRLNVESARLAEGFDAVCCFVNDQLNEPVLEVLSRLGVRFIALRSAGFNHVDLSAARRLAITVTRVPAYSPHAVAEHAMGLMLALNRKLHKAYMRVRENNFSLEGLMGFDFYKRTVGVVGTGAIGACMVRILNGFGCKVLLHDPFPNESLASLGEYVSIERIWSDSEIITLHCPLTRDTLHLVDQSAIDKMRTGVMIVNTSRGALLDTRAAIQGLKSGKIGSLALDVYEEEGPLFFEDHSQTILQDDTFARLNTFPNVLITAHQAFFTQQALEEIARVTIENLSRMGRGEKGIEVQ